MYHLIKHHEAEDGEKTFRENLARHTTLSKVIQRAFKDETEKRTTDKRQGKCVKHPSKHSSPLGAMETTPLASDIIAPNVLGRQNGGGVSNRLRDLKRHTKITVP